ncbi:hypothetical protein ES708_24713 [subsurface metagenome]
MVGQEKTYDLPRGTVMVSIQPRFIKLEGEYKGELYDLGKERIQVVFIDLFGYQPIGKLGVACIKITEYSVDLSFYRGMYSCSVRINDLGIDRANISKYEKLIRYFAKVIAGKMPAIVIEKP